MIVPFCGEARGHCGDGIGEACLYYNRKRRSVSPKGLRLLPDLHFTLTSMLLGVQGLTPIYHAIAVWWLWTTLTIPCRIDRDGLTESGEEEVPETEAG